MFSVKKRGYRGDGSGHCWPHVVSGSVGVVKDVFGPRPFTPHIATVGYDYDFHRGVDVDIPAGHPLYSPTNGAIIRKHYTHFHWRDADNVDEFVLTAPSGSVSYSIDTNLARMALSCSAVGVQNFPFGVEVLQAKTERVSAKGNDWVVEIGFSGTFSTVSGSFGVGLFSLGRHEHICLEYDGATFTTRASGSNSFVANGATFSSDAKTWMRLAYSASVDRYYWQHSVNGSTWTTLTSSETGRTFVAISQSFIPTLYWRSTGTTAQPNVVYVNMFNWVDESNTIGRFGNWLEIANSSERFLLMHMQHIEVQHGQFVSAGQRLGKAGETGFDLRSGRVLYEHCHFEYIDNNEYIYNNDSPKNPLGPSIMPRANVDNNVTVNVTEANDPDGVASHVLQITTSRQEHDFDVNVITLTGNLATRTVNFNTRSGLNADNDIPKNDGVYIVPSAFDENSASYVVTIYFNKATVGTSLTSWSVSDTEGTVLASG